MHLAMNYGSAGAAVPEKHGKREQDSEDGGALERADPIETEAQGRTEPAGPILRIQ
jgi:hypothetical protein